MDWPWQDGDDGFGIPAEEEDLTSYLTLEVGDGIFALDVSSVHEILDPQDMAPVPGAPHYVLGTFGLRGRSVLAVDGSAVFGVPRDRIMGEERLVVVAREGGGADLIGIAVDRVRAVEDLAADGFEAPPGAGTLCAPQVSGVMRRQGAAIMRVEIDRILGDLTDMG